MTTALADWVVKKLPNGRDFVYCDGSASFSQVLESSFEDASSITPVFFILSPGADPVKEVEAMGRRQIQGFAPNVPRAVGSWSSTAFEGLAF